MKNIFWCLLVVAFSSNVFAGASCDLSFISKAVHDAAYSCFIQNPSQLNESIADLASIQYPKLDARSTAINAVINNCVNPKLTANGLKPIGFLLDILVGISVGKIDRFDSKAFLAELEQLNCQ